MTIELDLNQIQTDFIRYAKINTRSYPGRDTTPSTPGQTELAKLLVTQLQELGLQDVGLNQENGFVTATLPANTDKPVKSFGIIAHLDTADYNAEKCAATSPSALRWQTDQLCKWLESHS